MTTERERKNAEADLAKRLEAATDKVLEEIFADVKVGKLPESERWAVNWGSLRCVQVVIGTCYSGGESDPYVEVLVEEVSPGDEVRIEIAKRLEAQGFGSVQVRTEW